MAVLPVANICGASVRGSDGEPLGSITEVMIELSGGFGASWAETLAAMFRSSRKIAKQFIIFRLQPGVFVWIMITLHCTGKHSGLYYQLH